MNDRGGIGDGAWLERFGIRVIPGRGRISKLSGLGQDRKGEGFEDSGGEGILLSCLSACASFSPSFGARCAMCAAVYVSRCSFCAALCVHCMRCLRCNVLRCLRCLAVAGAFA